MNTLSGFWQRNQVRFVAVSVIALLLLLAYWGGFPEHVTVGTLAFGLAFLLGVVIFFGFLVYYFYIAPLPEKERDLAASTSSPQIRYIVGTGAVIAATFIAVGLFWDELWHRLYGVGAVINDFFWRPHILLYAGMGINALFALGGMFLIMQRGKGTLRQRFRAEPLVGLLTLAAGFQIVTAPLDPVWHQIYGLDITAWSLPHLLLGLGIVSVMLVGSSIQFSQVKRSTWRILGSIGLHEVLALMLLALGATMFYQFGTTEWENIGPKINNAGYSFFQRPEWLYPVVLISLTAFIGMAALHLTRRIGSATIVFVFTLALRLLLMTVFNAAAANMSYKANLLSFAPVVALDLWYAYRLRTGRIDDSSTPFGGSLVLASATFLITLPLIGSTLYYPRLYPTVVIGMVVFGLLMAVAAGWAGSHVGSWLRTLGSSTIEQPAAANSETVRIFWVGAGALVAVLAFIAIFISTATPPVL